MQGVSSSLAITFHTWLSELHITLIAPGNYRQKRCCQSHSQSCNNFITSFENGGINWYEHNNGNCDKHVNSDFCVICTALNLIGFVEG